MTSFKYLNKADFQKLSTVLFNILADNMEKIAPTGNTREDDYACWYDGVSNGLKRTENEKSIGILEKLGLSKIGTNKSGSCYHFKGTYADLKKWYKQE